MLMKILTKRKLLLCSFLAIIIAAFTEFALATNSAVEDVKMLQQPVNAASIVYSGGLYTLGASSANYQIVPILIQPSGVIASGVGRSTVLPANLYGEDISSTDLTDSTNSIASDSIFDYLDDFFLVDLLFDHTAPNTSINLSGTLGSNNYYVSDVIVTLNASDDDSGVDKTEYSLDEGTSWLLYSAPFNISEDGTTTVLAKSIDKVGNVEDPPVDETIKIDKVQPFIVNQSPTDVVQTYRPLVTATLLDQISGIDSSSITMQLDGIEVDASFDPFTSEVSYISSSDLTQGKHIVNLSVQDMAGNSTTSSWSFVVFGTPVSGTISTNTTWTKDNGPYIAGNVAVNSGVTLTIEPGTIIKFNNSRLTIRGTLIANGAPSDKIIFTSIKDDSYGGDTNNDGSATTPAPNDWYAIDFVGGSGSQVTNSVIKYAGKLHDIWISGNTYVNEMTGAICICSSSSPTIANDTISKSVNGIHVHSSSPTIRENVIKENQQMGLYFRYANYSVIQGNTITDNGTDGIAFYGLSGLPVINQNTITGNQRGIYSHDTNGQISSDITNNTFTNNSSYALYLDAAWSPNISGNTASGNGYNGICITSTNKGNATWHAGDLPYISKTAIIDPGTTLTIEPGTIIKFDQSDLRVEGTLIANGAPSDKIIFTSIKDDSYGGDTNNDGSTTLPTRGDWKAIHFAPSTISCMLNNCIVRYGGKDFRTFYEPSMTDVYIQSNVHFRGSSPTVSNCIITDSLYEGITGSISSATITSNMVTGNAGNGILLRYCYSPIIEGNIIKNNIGDGLHCSDRNATPLINHNDIWGNSGKDLIDASPDTTDPVNAEYNWWGSSVNPSSKISGSLVDYDPWALSPYSAGIGGADAEGRYGSNTPCGYSGEPVNTALGNFVYEHEDLNIPGKGLPLQIARSYNSLDTVYNGPLGYAWTFNYNISLRLNADESITVMREDGRRHIYSKNPDESYTPPQGVLDILTKNPDGTYTLALKDQTKYNFAANGKLTDQVDKNGNITAFAYDADNNLTTVTDPGGRTLTFTWTGTHITKIQDQTGRNVQYVYNTSGDLTSVTDTNGYATTFTYNNEHQLITLNEPESSTNPFLTNHYTDGRVDYQYDAFLNQNTWIYDTVNKKTTCTDNKSGQTVHEYDESYRLTKVTDPLNYSTISGYSTFDQPDYVTNQNGKTTCFSYDANGNTISTKDPLNHEVTAGYDLSNNNLLWTKDALLRQITYNYDPTGINLMSITSPIGTTSFTYYSDGLLQTLTDANSHTTSFDYNAFGNLTSITDPLAKITIFEYDDAGRMTASIDSNGNKTQFTYDNLGNITTIKDPLAISDLSNRHQVNFTYDGNGNQKTFTDANNNPTSFGYDPMDNLTSVTDANNKTTSYTYDENYNLHTVTDPLLHTTTYDYLSDNKLWKITDPLSNILEFQYDPVGNLTKTIYPNTNETYYSYYDDNLLHTITYKNEPTSYTYTYNPTHTIDSVTDNNGKINSYQYDNGDRLTQAVDHTNPAHPTGFTVDRGYDGVSNLTSLSYAGDTYTYGYNARDDLTSLLLPTGSITFSYDDARNRTDVTTPDTTNRHYTYNEANRITGVTNTAASGTQNFTYTHDSNGNILTENTTSYSYDALNRLASWTDDGTTTTYNYDDAGNLLTVKENGTPIKSFTYNAANQITSTGFSYDKNGNLTSNESFNYIYDGENRLKKVTKVSDGSTVAEYTYDYLGRRTSKTVGGTTTYYHYDGWNVVAESDSTGAVVATYAYDDGSTSLTTGQPVSMTRGENTYFYQYNAHGDVVSLTDSSGNVVNSYEYDPWGKVLTANETIENPYRYAGYRYDAETGLYYLQHRYYSPQIMRFLTKDSNAGKFHDPKTLHAYAYVDGNPTNLTDPTGRFAVQVDVSFSGVIGRRGAQFGWSYVHNFDTGEDTLISHTSTEVKGINVGASIGLDYIDSFESNNELVSGESELEGAGIKYFELHRTPEQCEGPRSRGGAIGIGPIPFNLYRIISEPSYLVGDI